MPGRNPQQSQARPFGASSPLLPSLKCSKTDSERGCELLLGQPHKGPEIGNILAGPDVAGHEAQSLSPHEASLEILSAELGHLIAHRRSSM